VTFKRGMHRDRLFTILAAPIARRPTLRFAATTSTCPSFLARPEGVEPPTLRFEGSPTQAFYPALTIAVRLRADSQQRFVVVGGLLDAGTVRAHSRRRRDMVSVDAFFV